MPVVKMPCGLMHSRLGTFVWDDSVARLAALLEDLKLTLKVATDDSGLHRTNRRNDRPPVVEHDINHVILSTE